MRRQDALMLAMCLGTIAFAAAFVFPQFATQAVFWYYPLDHRWAYVERPSGLAIDFYGRLMFGAIAWCATVVAALAVTRKVRKALSARTTGLLAAWACTVTLLCAMHFAWTLYFRVPAPAAVPAWYQPR